MRRSEVYIFAIVLCMFAVRQSVGQTLPVATPTIPSIGLELRSDVSCDSSLVLIEHVAHIRAADGELKERIAQLDLTTLQKGETQTVSTDLLRLRCLLAGLPATSLRIVGRPTTQVSYREASPDILIEKALLEAFSQKLRLPANSVSVRITKPVYQRNQSLTGTYRPFLPDTPNLGPQAVRIGLYKQGSLIESLLVSIDVRLKQVLVVSSTQLDPNRPIQAGDVELQQREIDSLDYLTDTANAIDRKPTRGLPPGTPISARDLRRETSKEPILVARRTAVNVVARSKSLRVTLRDAEALDEGRMGDIVRVRNRESKQVISGRVVGDSTIEVSL